MLPFSWKSYLQYVVSRLDVGDVNPLAVNVGIVCVIAAGTQTLHRQDTHQTVNTTAQQTKI